MLPTSPPHGAPAGDPTAVVGRRIGAYAIDLLLGLIAVAIVLVPAFNERSETFSSTQFRCPSTIEDDFGGRDGRTELRGGFCLQANDEIRFVDDEGTAELSVLLYATSGAFGIANLVILQGLTGASIGKLLVGLRVIRRDGRKAHIGWAALRWLVLIIDAACCFLPGAVLVFTTKGHRRLGDMAAGTFVVRSSSVGQPPSIPGLNAPVGGGWTPPPATQGWTTSGDTQSWPTSTASSWPTAPSSTATPGAPEGRGPVWDEARNAYLQYDDARGAWLQWDAQANEWRPLDGGAS